MVVPGQGIIKNQTKVLVRTHNFDRRAIEYWRRGNTIMCRSDIHAFSLRRVKVNQPFASPVIQSVHFVVNSVGNIISRSMREKDSSVISKESYVIVQISGEIVNHE